MDEVRGWWVLVHFWPMTRGLDSPVTDDREGSRPPVVAGQRMDLSGMISWRRNPSACPKQELHSSCSCCVFVSEIRRAYSLVFFSQRHAPRPFPLNVANGAIEGRGSVVRNQ